VTDVFRFHPGDAALLVSVPHDGREIPPDIGAGMAPEGRAIPDTDWHVARLYEFVGELGASLLVANYSRYVIDLNRSPEDEHLYPGRVATGLCPERTFDGDAIYAEGGVAAAEVARRTATYWKPYHDRIAATLAALQAKHGEVVLWDAHSIASEVPRLFDGELPVLNIGTNDGASCAPPLGQAVADIAAASPYPAVVNGRFKGGFITRHYGRPADGVHAVQLEIAQRAYLDERSHEYDADKAVALQQTIRAMLETCLQMVTH
jgi:N-formylglutamate amidohydrolase